MGHEDEEVMDTSKSMPRRRWLGMVGMLPLATGMAGLTSKMSGASTSEKPSDGGGLAGARSEFEVESAYMNCASIHPIPTGAANAVKGYLDGRLMNAGRSESNTRADRAKAMGLFGGMVNAEQDELAWIPSTLHGENIVANGLGLSRKGSRVVTDGYHFMGSMLMYKELAKEGMDLHVVAPKDNRIDMDDLEKAITPSTRLVALTLVSNVAGFQHDLKAVCEIAHARGAMVYADIIQAAGCTPIDLKESGVDFAACSTYKWLMGDFGIGIMYARRESQAALKRSRFGYWQRAKWETRYSPFDEPGDSVVDTDFRSGLEGLVGVGTLASAGVAALTYSLDLLTKLGVENIETYRQPLIAKLQEELPSRGFLPMTPQDSRSTIVSFAYKNAAEKLGPRLKAAGVEISVHPNDIRISPSFFNTMDDIDRLIEAVS